VAEDDLTDSLVSLSRLLTGHQPLRETLTRIADFAVHAIPGADGAGLTMLEDDRPQTVVATAEFVRHVDDVQYGIGEGPCLLAVATGRTQVTGSLGGEARWPRFGPRVGRMGVNSALSLPLLLDGRVLGAMNVYAHGKDAFSDRAALVGEAYALPAAVSVFNAQILARSQRLAGQLQEALSSRAVIDQALGIVRSRTGCTEEEAMERLRRLSRTSGLKVSLVASDMVEEAVRGARARSVERPSGGPA
jgi:GAF domain-containing protein